MHFTRESIFINALRAFCNAFAVVLGIVLAVFIFFLFSGLSSPETFLPEKSQLTIYPDANGNRSMLPTSSPVVLRLDFHGVIGERDLTRSKFENLLLDSREGLLQNGRVKAILMHIDTPGGTVTDADGIYRLLINYKKKYGVPVYAYVDGLCASGGMYIASAADKIFASSTSVIGSIGVIQGPYFNFVDLMQKYGIQSKTLTEGKDKDLLNPFRPWKQNEDGPLVEVMQYFYKQFVDIVTSARPRLNKEKLIHEYGAHVFDPVQAMALGYIDQADSSYEEALSALINEGGIKEKEEYQVISLSPRHSFISQFTDSEFSLLKGQIKHTLPIGPYINSEMSGKILYLYQPTQ